MSDDRCAAFPRHSIMLRHLLLLLIVAAVSQRAYCQNDDQYAADDHYEGDGGFENDNAFPADAPEDAVEGSGANGLQETALDTALIEESELTTPQPEPEPADAIACPVDFCTCSHETQGESLKLTVDCSAKDLAELPSGIDHRVNFLLLQNNKLTELPKSISEFQELEELNINNNSITGFAFGSVSELPQLRVLKAANNRLLEFPQELKNGLDLRNLQELDLGGNDMRETLTADYFAHLEGISALTIPVSTPELIVELCHRLGATLQKVCTNNCDVDVEECAILPKSPSDMMPTPFDAGTEDEGETSEGEVIQDTSVETGETGLNAEQDSLPDPVANDNMDDPKSETGETIEGEISGVVDSTMEVDTDSTEPNLPTSDIPIVDVTTSTEFSLRSAVINANDVSNDPALTITDTSNMDTPTGSADLPAKSEDSDTNNGINKGNIVNTLSAGVIVESDVTTAESEPRSDNNEMDEEKVGAASVKQAGGIDNSIIALIVAGMVVVVAGVTIKKNWNSIRNRFRPRPSPGAGVTGADGVQANGTSPEEVPLQDKSVV